MTVENLLNFCNSLENGWLKTWKAHSMIAQLEQMKVDGVSAGDKLIWVHNCLRMEGFSEKSCDSIFEFMNKP